MRIDLNADLGESFGRWQLGDDEAMLEVITSANVACGFHAGDPTTLRRTCRRRPTEGVRIGAQVSYRDLAGFGRRFIDVSPADLTADVLYQLSALDGLAASAGSRVSYLKPHGALYNTVVEHAGQAEAVLDAVAAFSRPLPVLGLPGSVLLRRATERGIEVVTEYFIDRNYTADGSTGRPQATGRDDHRSAAGRRTCGCCGHRRSRPVVLHPRRLAGGGPDGHRGPGRARVGRGRDRPVQLMARRLLPYGDRAVLVECADLDEMRALHDWLKLRREDRGHPDRSS